MSVLDALNEIASFSRREDVQAKHAVDTLFSNATAQRLEAFMVAANDLVAILGNEPRRCNATIMMAAYRQLDWPK